jgi:2-keto-3-deoxy-L-rhamnonate aldolase RhmA
MNANPLRSKLSAGLPVMGTMIQEVSSPFIVHALANAGFDFVYVDMEHGRFGLESAIDLIQILRFSKIAPLVRVPDNQYHFIARLMDAGAVGVMIPRVESRAQAEAAVQSMRYPPIGQRGLAVARGHNDYKRQNSLEFAEQANKENLLIVQIESTTGVEKVDEIVSTPGVDVALIGPGDLSLSLGITMKMDHPKMVEAIEKVVASCKNHKIEVGLHVGDLKALGYWNKKGIHLLSGSADLDVLLDGCINLGTSMRAVLSE